MSFRLVAVAVAAVLLAGCESGPDESETTGPPADVDLVGLWNLQEATIDGTETTISEGAHVTLAVRPRATQAHDGCSVVEMDPRVEDAHASFVPVNESFAMLSCPHSFTAPSGLPDGSYFEALDAVDRARRIRDALVLTGPDVTLVYELEHPVGRR